MGIPEFKLERYFARWEFTAPYLLCVSDAESFGIDELLAHADPKAQALWDGLHLGYTESPGHPLLRAEISGLYSGLDPDDVLVFAGAEEAIFTYMSVALGAGDHAVVVWPCYQSLFEAARAVGADVSLIRLRYEDQWRLNVDEVAAAMRPNTRVLVVNFPHNPTGALPDRTSFDALIALCERRGVALFCDEVYRYGEFEEVDRLPGACESGTFGVSLGGLAKAFGLAGLRIGWIAMRDRALLQKLSRFKDYLTICNSAPSEILGIIALRAKDVLLSRNRSIALANLAMLDRFFERRASALEWIRPRAGLVAFPRLLGAASADDFAARLVEKTGVLILPGSVFDYEGEYFRIGFGRKNMPEALGRLKEFLEGVVAV